MKWEANERVVMIWDVSEQHGVLLRYKVIQVIIIYQDEAVVDENIIWNMIRKKKSQTVNKQKKVV
jgi:hypothetical protein